MVERAANGRAVGGADDGYVLEDAEVGVEPLVGLQANKITLVIDRVEQHEITLLGRGGAGAKPGGCGRGVNGSRRGVLRAVVVVDFEFFVDHKEPFNLPFKAGGNWRQAYALGKGRPPGRDDGAGGTL